MLRRNAMDLLTGSAVPWGEEPGQFLSVVRERVPYDALALGVLQAPRPQLDEVLLVRGLADADVRAWCDSAFEQDKLLRAAMRAGAAVTEPGQNDTSSSLARNAYAVLHAVPASLTRQTWWWLLLARRSPAFLPQEQQLAGLMLRQWQVRFDQPAEPDMHRLLIGHDDRLILADLACQARLLRQPTLVRDLLAAVHPVVEQRYPGLPDHATRDLAVRLGDEPAWVCFRSSRAIDTPAAKHLYVELRPLDDDELPAVGTVKDDRIAQSIAFIHENFHRSPSLAEVAKAVHVSPFHFHRLFTRQVGLSPKHYLQRKQLQVAKWLLRRGGVPIGAIAQQTGFSSHGHFTSTFHRLVGKSPSEYRDHQQGISDS